MARRVLRALESPRFVIAIILGIVASLFAILVLLLDMWILLMAGMASAKDSTLLGPNNAPFFKFFWAPPVLFVVALLLFPRKRSYIFLGLIGLFPAALILMNLLFFLDPSE